MSPRASKTKTALRIGILILAFALLFYLLDTLGLENILTYGQRLGWLGFGLVLVFGYLENLFDSLALRECVHQRIHPFKVLFINQAGTALNMFVPFEGGEVFKFTLLRKQAGGENAVAGVILWNYVCKLTKSIGILVAALLAWLLAQDGQTDPIYFQLVLLALLSFLIYLAFRFFIKHGTIVKLVNFITKFGLLKKSADQWVAKAKTVDRAVNRFHRETPGAYYRTVALQLLARVVNLVTLWYLLVLLGDHSLATALLVYAGINLATFITLVFPNRVGVDEGAGYLLFALLSLDPKLGIMIQFIIRLKNTLITGLALPIAVSMRTPPADPAKPGSVDHDSVEPLN